MAAIAARGAPRVWASLGWRWRQGRGGRLCVVGAIREYLPLILKGKRATFALHSASKEGTKKKQGRGLSE